MTIPMALVDFLPVIFFAAAGVVLQRGLYEKMSKGAFALLSAGTIMISAAGIFKASWKLMYAAGLCDFARLNQAFFPMQSLGFLLAGISIVAMMTFRQSEKKQDRSTRLSAIAAPAVYSGTMIFVAMMVVGVGCMNIGLAIQARKQKKPVTMVLFIVSFVLMLMMGYLSSKDFTKASMNWIAEAVNLVAQGMFLLASLQLTRKPKEA